jgi:protein TonB
MGRTPLIVVSLAAHFALAFGLGRLEVKRSHAATAIEIANVPKKAKAIPPEPAKAIEEPPKPAKAPHEAHRAAPAPVAQNTPPPPPAEAPSVADAMPDFGLSLSGGVGGDGFAIPGGAKGGGVGPGSANAKSSAPIKKALSAAPAAVANGCDEAVVKPKPRGAVPPAEYTASARAAGIEGKVRVRLTVDETGNVVDATIIAGLGYGLDEAALAAARSAHFEPATQCGKPVRATFNLSMRFSAV